MNFVQQMIKQSAVVHAYYKTYYLSKAWIELGLTQIKYRGAWFNYVVYTGDKIVLDNLLCKPNCTLSTTLSGTASLLSKKFWQGSTCTSPYVLSGGTSLIVPLFKDTYAGSVSGSFTTGIHYQNLANIFKDDEITIQNISSPDMVTFWLLLLSGEDLHENGVFFKSWTLTTSSLRAFKTAFETYMIEVDPALTNYYGLQQLIDHGLKMYLMISNTAQATQSLCLQTTSTPLTTVLPTDVFFIQRQASYLTQKVALDASYAQPIPNFLFSTYSTYQ
jgi:hypothetical protein